MKAGRSILLVLITVLLGCTTFKSFEPLASHTNNDHYLSLKDKLHFTCDLNEDVGRIGNTYRDLQLKLWFDKDVKPEIIKNITIDINPDNKQVLMLDNIYMRSEKKIHLSDAEENRLYRKENFVDLPGAERLTTWSGTDLFYEFNYKSKKNIRTEMLSIMVLIELQSGRKIEVKDDFYLHKVTTRGLN